MTEYIRLMENHTLERTPGFSLFHPQLSPPSDELTLQTNFRYDSRNCFFKSNSIIKEGKCSMKKVTVLLASVLVLTACTQPKKEAKKATASKTEQTSIASSSAKEEQALKFVVAPQYEGKTSDLMELGKKLVKEHPEAGKQGEVTLYYTGSTYTLDQQEYVVLMLVNKTTTNIDHDAEFKLNWSYDGQPIYQNQLVEYRISENGTLPTQSATIFLLPLTKEQQSIVESITDGTKTSLSMSDLMMK